MRISHNGAFEMFYMRLAHPFEVMALDEFYNSPKTRFHVGWQSLKLVSNAGVEQFNDSRHPFIVLHFCNTAGSLNLNAIMPPCS